MTVLYAAVAAAVMFGALFAAALCRIAALSDRDAERLWEKERPRR